jgi:hypothetical protein
MAAPVSLTPDHPVIADTDQWQPRVSVAQPGDDPGDRVSHLLLVLNRWRLCTYLLTQARTRSIVMSDAEAWSRAIARARVRVPPWSRRQLTRRW